jgi:hypothetical protein
MLKCLGNLQVPDLGQLRFSCSQKIHGKLGFVVCGIRIE